MKQIRPAKRKTVPCKPDWGAINVAMAVANRPIPIIKRVAAANTIRQFSLTFGWLKQELPQ